MGAPGILTSIGLGLRSLVLTLARHPEARIAGYERRAAFWTRRAKILETKAVKAVGRRKELLLNRCQLATARAKAAHETAGQLWERYRDGLLR